MLFISLKDLRFRQRRFVIVIAGTTLMFAMALVMAGISQGFRNEARKTVSGVGADAWVVADGNRGPFIAATYLPESMAERIGRLPGVREADPLLFMRETITHGSRYTDVAAIGYRVGGLGAPPMADGRAPTRPGEIVIDHRLHKRIGERLRFGTRDFVVTGRTRDRSVLGGEPVVYMAIDDVQALSLGGQHVAGAIVTRGRPRGPLPPGLRSLSTDDARRDLLRPVAKGVQTFAQVQILMWALAALLVGAVIYLSTLERTRDFAVLKALGASSTGVLSGLALQAVVVAAVGAGLAALLATRLVSTFPLPVDISNRALLASPVAALAVGLAASLAGLRRAVAVDPADAFGAA